MSKKDFELIARVIAHLEVGYQEHEHTARAFADALAETNPRFDRARFLRACGVTS